MKQVLLTRLGVGLLSLTTWVAQQGAIAALTEPYPLPDRQGDYYTNHTPLKGKVPKASKLMPGSLWLVVSAGLNCRRSLTTKSAIVRQFKRGDVLQAEVARGGSDEVLQNAKDTEGRPWMPVRPKSLERKDICYVRANNRFLQPVTPVCKCRRGE
jgi:hypothetical protein